MCWGLGESALATHGMLPSAGQSKRELEKERIRLELEEKKQREREREQKKV